MRKLEIEQLSIRTSTNDGMYGVDIPFSSGLNIIHAENTHGKSTCIQSIVFALGLEGALGPSRKVPLKSALTSQLRKADSSIALIFESNIYLQLSNGLKTITIKRSSNPDKKDLISVFENINAKEAILGNVVSRDYFLRLEGSATRERGFHTYLSEFLEMKLPKVFKYDGSECLLYLEAIFSMNYVEQTRGWGGILNILPTYLSIKDLSARVIEYTLNLDVQNITNNRNRYNQKKKDAERLWSIGVDNLISVAKRTAGCVSMELNDKIQKNTIVSDSSYLYQQIESEKNSYNDRIDYLSSELALLKLRNSDNEVDEEKVARLEAELHEQEILLGEQERAISLLRADLELSQKYTQSIGIRIHDVNDSLRKYKDLLRLESIGSEENFNLSITECPTCRTEIEDSLLPHFHQENTKVLGLDDNIKYLEKQRETFDALLKSERQNTNNKEMRLQLASQQVLRTRSIIREVKSSLTDVKAAPSRSDIKKELIIEGELELLDRALREEAEIKGRLRIALDDWKSAEEALQGLPRTGFSLDDRRKLKALRDSFVQYARDFGYSSNELEDFRISEQSYKPALNDVDINSEASASDNIRVIWSYLYSILTLDQRLNVGSTNHLGFLILDEPRQQEAKNESFKEFISKVADVKRYGKQVIIGTSENYSDLISTLKDLEVNLSHFESDIIKKINI
ncbi:hypothetical protein [Photobacterium damselae]|uniref:Rad50/SbcC-type AAA domain-containing protein n=1 Tax=Photobacterium damselae subsp. damselae TaxID=85581 RepID=A0AAD3WU28_PHODD|nr:hypothetical protein [Photobacterium damselae]KAB1178933.1 hypothetical protein F6450_14660 [Photobacterium damselae subsp. damselae]